MTWWPGWDSIDGSGFWAHFWFWFGIGCLFALGASEIVSHVYSLRKDELVEAAATTADTQRKNDQAAIDARHTMEIDGVRKTLTDAERKVADAEKKVAELERLRAFRRVTDDQKAKLTKFITENSKGTASFTIKASAAESDARAYADEIAALFNAAPINWQVRVDNAMILGADTSGMWISVKSSGAIPPATGLLRAAFEDAGFPIRKDVHLDPGITSPDEIWLTIGGRK